ncbi:MAG: hypothetical protein KDD70_02115 [Bdellovibrionales bacterium]|nr:hypothetical protein [Bdellovibrionales bacterium]
MGSQLPATFQYQPLRSRSPVGGLFFFLTGTLGIAFQLFFVATGTGSLAKTSPTGELIFLIYSFLFALVGAAILFFQKTYLFNRDRKVFTPSIRLPFLTVTIKSISYQFIDAVQISRKVMKSGNTTSLMFSVSLVQDSQPDIVLERLYRYPNAKRIAELLSLALQKPLHDNSSGRMVVKQPGEFKATLKERLDANLDISEQPLKPKDMEAMVTEHRKHVVMQIPPFGILDSLLTLLLPAFALFLFLYFLAYLSLGIVPPEIVAYSLLVPIVFVIIAGSFLFRTEVVEITTEEFAVHWGFFGFGGTEVYPISELEGLYVVGREDDDDKIQFLKALTRTETQGRRKDIFYPFRCLSSSVIAKAGNRSVTFGRSLDIEELTYLVFLMEVFIKKGSLRQ